MDIFGLWNRRRSGRGPSGRRRVRQRLRRPIEFLVLEDRRLFSVSAISAKADPNVLPDNGRFFPITISGTVQQVIQTGLGKATSPPPNAAAIDAANESKPAPTIEIFVTDQYRTIEPRLKTNATQLLSSATFFTPFNSTTHAGAQEGLVRTYSYSVTVFLQARSHNISRQYTINVNGTDGSNVAQQNIAVLVPTASAHVEAPVYVPPHSVTGLPGLSPKKKR